MSLRFFIDSALVIQGIHRKMEPLWGREAFYQASYDRLSSMENTTACKETEGGGGEGRIQKCPSSLKIIRMYIFNCHVNVYLAACINAWNFWVVSRNVLNDIHRNFLEWYTLNQFMYSALNPKLTLNSVFSEKQKNNI